MADIIQFPGDEPPDDEAVAESGVWDITCERELGTWTIRMNGCFVFSSWRASPALKLYSRLMKALSYQ